MLKAVSLSEEHLEDAALLVSNRYQRLRQQVPHLPHSYADVTKQLPLLQKKSYPHLVLEWRYCAGIGWLVSSRLANAILQGLRSIYSPDGQMQLIWKIVHTSTKRCTAILQPSGLQISI